MERSRLPLAVVISLASLGAMAWTLLRGRPPAPAVAFDRFAPATSGDQFFARNGEGGFALSPDGTMLAFVGRTEGKAQLWVRSLGESESRLLPGSEGAYDPFWSPDSRWIAFFTPQKLKKTEVATGALTDLYDRPNANLMGSWSPSGVIVTAFPNSSATPLKDLGAPIMRMPDAGGMPVPVPGTERGVTPHFLPDGRRGRAERNFDGDRAARVS